MKINVRVTIPDCEHCGREGEQVFDRFLSYDLEHIWSDALLPFDPSNNGKIALELVPILEKGLARLQKDADKYKALVPEDGAGTWEGLLRFTQALLAVSKEKPRAVVTMEIEE